jgi:hypothetical protein
MTIVLERLVAPAFCLYRLAPCDLGTLPSVAI